MAAGLSFDAAIGRLRAVRSGAGGSAIGVFGVRVAAACCAYVAQVLMARLMGGAEYGIFAAVWVWVAILGHSATLGLSQGACRFIPAEQAIGRYEDVRGFLLGGAAVTLLAALAVSALGVLVLRAEGSLLAGAYGASILMGALVLPLFALQDYCEGVARSQNWPLLAIAPPYLIRQGLIVAAMLAAVLLGLPAEARTAIACTLVATGASLAIQAVLLLVRLRGRMSRGPRRYRWRLWFHACLPIAAVDAASAAFGFVDVVVLGFLMPPAALGLYFAATRIQQFVAFVHYAASAATAQLLSAAKARGDRAGLSALVRERARWTFTATAVVGLCVLAASPLLLGLFGPDFHESLPILAVLVAGSVGASFFGPAEDILTMLGGERLCAGITALMLALSLMLCLALVPAFGLIGAACAMAAATVLRGLALALGARAIHGLSTPVLALPRLAVAR